MATNDKYDRQLRLWGPHGQRRLAEANICLLNAGPTGTEALKNLVLPGAGKFTIVDVEKVSLAECACNFFVSKKELGKSRAKVACEYLTELNPGVQGTAVVEDPDSLIDRDPDFFKSFSIVIATQLTEHYVKQLSKCCMQHNVPVIVGRTYGLIGSVRHIVAEHCVMEAKPSPEPALDIRIANPFPELVAFVDNVNMETMDDKQYKHVPYLVVLVKLARVWKSTHNGKLPSTSVEKEEFRQQLRALARKPWGEEENLFEGLAQAYHAYGPRPIPYEVQNVLDVASKKTPAAASSSNNARFWIMALALHRFVDAEGHGALPLQGKLPDMTSTTDLYVDLQKLYQAKAAADFEAFSQHVDAILSTAETSMEIPDEDRRTFCRNAYHIQVCQFRTFEQEISPESANQETFMMATMEGVGDATAQCPLLWYFMLRACDQFYEVHARYPGTGEGLDLAADIEALFQVTQKLCTAYSFSSEQISKSHAKEMVRYGAGEIHNVASLIGGIVSQEVIKLLTAQYVPLNNTYLYNGITCTGAVYNL